jgi:proteic killer suppression protein
MIESFADKTLERLYYSGASSATKKIPADLHRAINRRLAYLHDATSITDLRVPPANRLEALKGDLAGWHSIRVNDQWRIIFRWINDAALDVTLIDYH